jgi:uncharacterized repeat protein (TIGR03837 family)
MKVDLFCQVVDNYGDIGVCWGLARQLVAEHGCEVRLIVDDLRAFRVIAPAIDPAVTRQILLGVEIVAWRASKTLLPQDVVIEAFACNPPARYIEAMAQRSPKPIWINLEYLSAEAWVDDIHGMASQHQRLPLTKYFFCPGFTVTSGGLLREPVVGATCRDKSLLQRQLARDPLSALRIFAFAYPHAPVRDFTVAFAAAGIPTTVTLAAPLTQAESGWQTAALVAQTQFDALLAEFDFLIVRGEDSFMRAQWAAIPFLWHIYPTDDGAHLIKLDAWLDRYCVGLDANASAAYRAASQAFNAASNDDTQREPYELLAQNLSMLREHALRWRDGLRQQTDLATRLLEFVGKHKANNLG